MAEEDVKDFHFSVQNLAKEKQLKVIWVDLKVLNMFSTCVINIMCYFSIPYQDNSYTDVKRTV